jgi:hypothetical protein
MINGKYKIGALRWENGKLKVESLKWKAKKGKA